MRVMIKSNGHRYFIPVPLCLGGLGLRIGMKFGAKDYLTKNEQKEILRLYKVLKKELKFYKGLQIVDVKAANGEEVSVIV